MKLKNLIKTAYITRSADDVFLKTKTKAKFVPYQYYFTKKGIRLRSKKRICAIFVPRTKCTNRCIFCTSNIPAMEKIANHKLTLDREFSVKEMVADVKKLYQKNKDASEIVIGAGIGEPFLYFNKLLKFISKLKKEMPLPIRLNTNGQALVILPQYSTQDVCKMFEKAGLDSIMISLNAVNERDYNTLSRPKLPKAFKSVIDFIKVCNKSNIKTHVSFLDYSETCFDYPKLDKNKIKKFLRSLGLKEKQIIYRPFIYSTKEFYVKEPS